MSPEIFISYSREDQHQVVRLVEYLRKQGLAVWMDETDIHGATMWTEEIVEAIHSCNLFILAISSHSTGSKNVVKELALASEREKIILPIYLEQCDIPKNMEYQLAGIQNIALHTLDKAKAYEFVYQTIRRLGVGQAQTEHQELGQAEASLGAGHSIGIGHGQIPPPKAKGHAGKWICITAAVVVLAVASFFLSQSVNEKTDISELTHPSMAATETSPNIGSHRIALLPFEVNAAKEEDKWVGGGMDNELKTALNKIDGVTIIAGLSVNGYRGANREISKIKSNLNVDYILDGSITVTGSRTSLNLDFIKANDLSTLWSESIQATPETIFDSKTKIAAKLSTSLNIQIGTKTSAEIGAKHTENAEAFQLYTRGRGLWMTRTQTGMKQCIKLYEQAVQLDDSFALAFTGIADAYSMLSTYGFMDSDEAYPKARKFVLDAISRDPELSEAYTSLGWIQFAYEWKLKDSEKSYRKSLKLNPKIAQAHQWLGINLHAQGKFKEAYNSYKLGLDLDPNHHVLLYNFSECCNSLGFYNEGKIYSKKSISVNPLYPDSWLGLYVSQLLSGADSEILANLISEIEGKINKNAIILNILIHYYHKRDSEKYKSYLNQANELDKLSGNSYLQNRVILEVGIDRFIEMAEHAYKNNTFSYGIPTDIFMFEYRNHPKFVAFVEKIRKGK